MVSMLKAVGFSGGNISEIEDYLVEFAMEKAEKEILLDSNNKPGTRFEFFIPVAENTGIIFRGLYDKVGKMRITHLFPAHISTHESICHSLDINKRFDSDAYLAMCNDNLLGFMMFYIQNQHGIHTTSYQDNPSKEYKIKLSCLCDDGIIILPTNPVNVKEKVTSINSDIMSIPDLSAFDSDVADIYSLVDTTFHPAGADNDSYCIVGKILEINEQTNKYTGEQLYIFLVESNEVLFEVCINKDSLMGTPKVGRRFKGDVWLQGRVEWN